jgi:hypothetical protein
VKPLLSDGDRLLEPRSLTSTDEVFGTYKVTIQVMSFGTLQVGGVINEYHRAA